MQRGRLLRAFARVCARHGCAGASVERTIADAGVSRATFYEQFGNREECCLAAVEWAGANLRRHVVEAVAGARGSERPAAALRGLLQAVAADPPAAQLFLVEARGASAPVRAAREALVARAASALERLLHEDGELSAPPFALLGGMDGVLAARLLRGERNVEALEAELLAWLRSYGPIPRRLAVLPAWRTTRSGPAGGAMRRDRSWAEGGRRERILAAVARLAREKGYAAMTVSDVVTAASVSRESFYRHFGGKLDAFAAAQEEGLHGTAACAAPAFFSASNWPHRVWAGLEAMLRYAHGEPELACVDLVESYAAGHGPIGRSIEHRMAFTVFLDEGYREGRGSRLPRLCSEAISAAIAELLRREVRAGGRVEVHRVLPQAAYVALAPFIGPVEAVELVNERSI